MNAETILAEIRELIGENEFAGHAQKWREAAERNPEHLAAALEMLRRAIARPEAGPKIRNRGGWLWGGYCRRIGDERKADTGKRISESAEGRAS